MSAAIFFFFSSDILETQIIRAIEKNKTNGMNEHCSRTLLSLWKRNINFREFYRTIITILRSSNSPRFSPFFFQSNFKQIYTIRNAILVSDQKLPSILVNRPIIYYLFMRVNCFFFFSLIILAMKINPPSKNPLATPPVEPFRWNNVRNE